MSRNESAARAYLRFPNETDLEVILGQSKPQKLNEERPEASFSMLHESTTINEAMGDHYGHFSDFLAGKIPIQTPACLAGGNALEMQLFSC